jgi:hypothetical protein
MRFLLSAILTCTLAGAAAANDSMAALGVGGLIFVTTDEVELLSEDLYVSSSEVRVTYEFRNNGSEDISTLVAFPMPDIIGKIEEGVYLPSDDPENPFGFATLFEGRPVDAELHQSVFANSIDYTKLLRRMGLPLNPQSDATYDAVQALSEADQMALAYSGLVYTMQFDAGQGWTADYVPVWTLKSAYSWEAVFPAGETVTVEHSYTPSIGGTVAVNFFSEPYEDYDPAAEYADKYCTDEPFLDAVRRTLASPDDAYSAPFTETWVTYIWSTGANWGGPVRDFRLVVDKENTENLVSFCWDGEVTKIGPTQFEARATDWWPPYGRELEILVLKRRDDY